MVITGSVILIRPGSSNAVLGQLKKYPSVTFHVQSEPGTELIVNFEAEGFEELENLCEEIKDSTPDIIDITHVYLNFEEEIEKPKT